MGQHMDRLWDLVMAEWLGDRGGDKAGAQRVTTRLHPGVRQYRGRRRAAQADESLLDARTLGQDLAGVLGFWIIGSARVSLQRALGLAEPAQVFAQDLHIRIALLAPLTLRHTWTRNNEAMRAPLGAPAVSLQ